MRGASTPDDELIDLIYAALLGESTWQRFLDGLANSAPSGKTVMVMHDNNIDNGYIPLASGISKHTLTNYNGYFSHVNPFMKPASVRPTGVGYIDEELVPKHEIERTEFFNDLLAPNEMPSRVALTITRESDYQFILASLGSAFDEECKRNVADQLTRLSPHLKRAADYYRNAPEAQTASELGASIFDAVDMGLVIIGDGFRVKAISRAGSVIVRQTSLLGISILGTVSIRDEQAQSLLSDMLKRTYSGPKVASLVALGTRMTFIRTYRDDISLFFNGPSVILLLENRARRNAFDIALFASAFDLSRAETRALAGIVGGKTVTQISQEAGLSRETIRSQLKSLYAKTGTHGQTDLLRLILLEDAEAFTEGNRHNDPR